MSLRALRDVSLPQAYGGCACSCHRMPGVSHVMACCRPGEQFAKTALAHNAAACARQCRDVVNCGWPTCACPAVASNDEGA